MSNLIKEITKFPSLKYSTKDWNDAVLLYFSPFLRRKYIIKQHTEIFRSELVNLAIIQNNNHLDLLSKLIKINRSIIYKNPISAFNFLIECFEGTVKADENFMNIYLTQSKPSNKIPLQDRIIKLFDLLDSTLEGSYKLQLRIIFGFAMKKSTGSFPTNISNHDFGALTSYIKDTYSNISEELTKDKEHNINVNQWRNIAAHKTYTVKSSRTIEIKYGRNPGRTKRISYASLNRILSWAVKCNYSSRMANLLIYLEFMPELKKAGLPNLHLRLDSAMVNYIHNMNIVGFKCIEYGTEKGNFVVTIQDLQQRNPKDAIIHASQTLDILSLNIELDPTIHNRNKYVLIRLVNSQKKYLAGVKALYKNSKNWAKEKVSIKKRLDQTIFDFAN